MLRKDILQKKGRRKMNIKIMLPFLDEDDLEDNNISLDDFFRNDTNPIQFNGK